MSIRPKVKWELTNGLLHPALAKPAGDWSLMTTAALQESIAHAQVACRAENENIHASADKLAMIDPIPFVCECADPQCFEIVRLTFDEYDSIRQFPRRFFNLSGHERASVEARAERVVVFVQELTVVEKVGIAGQIAADRVHDRFKG